MNNVRENQAVGERYPSWQYLFGMLPKKPTVLLSVTQFIRKHQKSEISEKDVFCLAIQYHTENLQQK